MLPSIINLNGQWEFYPFKYYAPQQFSSEKVTSPVYVSVPGDWTNYYVNNKRMSAFGYATYRLKIILNTTLLKNKQILALNIPAVFSAYKLWIDTVLTMQYGIMGQSAKEHKARISPIIIPFVLSKDTVDITIQVADYFSHRFAGIRAPINFGLYDSVLNESRLKEYFYLGSSIFCMTLGLFFFFLALLKQEIKINLLFAISSLIMGVRYLFDKEDIILLFFPHMGTALMYKILFLCMNFFPFLLWSAFCFFPQEINKRVVQLTGILFFIYTIVVIILPFRSYDFLLKIYFVFAIVIMLYVIITSGVAYSRKRTSAGIFFYGMLLAPVIFYYNMFTTAFYAPVGAILFLIFQAAAITTRFVRSHKRVLQLSGDLQVMNDKLEILVDDRTKELNIANKSLEKLNFAKDKFISILSHDLRNPLSGLLGLSRRLIINAEKNNSDKIIDYSKMINESAAVCYTLAENLLDWSLIQSELNGVTPVKIYLTKVVDEVFELLRNEAALKQIELTNKINDDCQIISDIQMTKSVVRNLVTNAIKFSHHNSCVEISARRYGSFWHIDVTDTGIGMGKEELNNLFRIDRKVYNLGTDDEPGSGFGLVLTKEFVESNGGTISAKSEKGKGTVFTFTLPVFETVSSIN